VTNQGAVRDLRERIIASHSPKARLRDERSVAGFMIILFCIAVAETIRHGLTLYGAFLFISTAGGIHRIRVLRRYAITDTDIDRAQASARPCGRCGLLVASFETRCPRCGSLWRRLHRDQWIPLLFVLAFVVCVAAGIALSR